MTASLGPARARGASPARRLSRFLPAALGCAALLASAAGCAKDHAGGADSAKGGARPGAGRPAIAFPVEVQPVSTRQVEYTVTAVGSVEAFEIVQVTARVPGAVERVSFAEGDVVAKGDLLVEIEPDRYRLEVDAARAALEKAEAEKSEAEAGLARRDGAVERNPGLIPAEEIETWRTRVRTATAGVAAAQAAADRAEMNLGDARPRAPFGGTIQSRDVQTGRYVQPGTLLATLLRRDPLLLRFRVPEGDAARLEPGMAARLTVRDDAEPYAAKIIHVAESADEVSRMVPVTAEVNDPRKARLRPGSFAEVVVPVGSSATAPVIPETAIRPSERGFLAFVIEEGTARERVLTLGMRTADGLVEVREGLAGGESLVVRGAEALRDGAAVRVAAAGDSSVSTAGAAR